MLTKAFIIVLLMGSHVLASPVADPNFKTTVKELVDKAGKGLQNIYDSAVSSIKGYFNDAVKSLKRLGKETLEFAKQKANEFKKELLIKVGEITNKATEELKKLKDSAINSAADFFKTQANSIIDSAQQAITNVTAQYKLQWEVMVDASL